MEGSIHVTADRPPVASADALYEFITQRIRDFDMIVISGGVSKGDTDYVHSVLEVLGVEYLFKGVDMKPGKPVSAAIFMDRPILALPGNPLAAAVTFRMFGASMIRALTGAALEYPIELPAPSIKKRVKSDQFVPARMVKSDTNTEVELVSSMGSGDFTSIARSNGFIKIPREGEEKSSIDFYPWYSWRQENQ